MELIIRERSYCERPQGAWQSRCVPLFLLLFSFPAFGQEVRKPAVAGAFYPGTAGELRSQVEGFLKQAGKQELKEAIIGLIAPHAGYVYSGKTAGYAYRAIQDGDFSTVVVLARSHVSGFQGAILDDRKYWETPLGKVELDHTVFNALYKKPQFHINKFLMDREHSLEVQVPFLQICLKNFTLVPVLLGDSSWENVNQVAEELYQALSGRKSVLYVASTDLSHYYPLAQAEQKDKVFLRTLEQCNSRLLKEKIDRRETEICGDAAVLALLKIVEKSGPYQIRVLHYGTSADASGDAARVVGYAGAAVVKGKTAIPRSATGRTRDEGGNAMLTKEQRKKLLVLARQTIENNCAGKKLPPAETEDPVLKEKRGVFVTLHKKGNLRGCIGYIMPMEPLINAVQKMAVESSSADPRFPPVTAGEVRSLEIEISVLTVPKRVKDADEVVLGRDGVIVKRGFQQGVFLPQVAAETGWTKEEFLSNLCSHKAGLPPDSWKDPQTEIHTFQAEVFSESEF